MIQPQNSTDSVERGQGTTRQGNPVSSLTLAFTKRPELLGVRQRAFSAELASSQRRHESKWGHSYPSRAYVQGARGFFFV